MGDYWDSNLVILHGTSGIHLDMPGADNDITVFQSMIGRNFVTCHHDYFGDTWDRVIPHPGIGQVIKFRVNHLPLFAQILGDIEDGGDPNPDDPNDILNAFAGSEGEYFCSKDSEYFIGKAI